MADLAKQDRIIFRSVFVLLVALILVIQFYEGVDLDKQVSEAEPRTIEGAISGIQRSNSFVVFNVNGKAFRSQQSTAPCLDVIKEIEVGRIVEFEYVFIDKWPSFKVSGNCILKAKFLTNKKSRSGRSKINT